MASNTGFLSTTELDFNSIKQNLKTYLQNQSQFADYNFDGSNINVLLDILSYNTYLNAFYLNQVGSEMFLDTAQLKESAVSHAKELNYVPQSRTSAVAYISFTVDTGGVNPPYLVVPKNYKFTSTVDGTNLSFTIPQDITIRPVNNVYSVSNTAIYEGEIVTEYFYASNGINTFTLSSQQIDTSSISVEVFSSNTSTTSYVYTEASSLFTLTPYSNVYFVQGYSDNQYQIVFGNGNTGSALQQGNFVQISYRDTLGDAGNGAYIFNKSGTTPDGYSVGGISTNFAASGGSEREDIDSIKFNAPRYFPVQERAVTAADYVALTLKEFPMLESAIAYGGEQLTPPQYGKVAISVKPYGLAGLVSNSLKTNIVNFLNLKNLTTQPIVVDPDFYYIHVDTTVNFDSTQTTFSANQIESLVSNTIYQFGQTNLVNFGDDLRYSKLVAAIDETDPSIVGNATEFHIVKRWTPPLNTVTSLTFSYNNELFHEQVLYAIPAGHELAFYSDSFTYTHTDGNNYTAFIADDGLGNLFITTYVIVSGVNTRKYLTQIGTVDVYTGDVVLQTQVTAFTGSHINLYGLPQNKDILANKNNFLLLDPTDFAITINDVSIN